MIIMDINMTGMNGIEATAKIREFEESKYLRKVHIIAHSGDDSSEHIKLCRMAGMNEHYTKPLKRE
jgi:CheY-like chemotaxis protein